MTFFHHYIFKPGINIARGPTNETGRPIAYSFIWESELGDGVGRDDVCNRR